MIGTVAAAVGQGFPFNNKKKGTLYLYCSGGIGLALGAAVGVEYGLWWDLPKDYDGPWVGVEGSFASSFGAAVGLYFTKDMKFLGFLIVPQVGLEAELKFVEGRTWNLMKFSLESDDD